MKYLCLILLICNKALNAQDTLCSEMVESFSYKFNIQNEQFNGEGADSLMTAMQQSHFVLLGETHDDAKIAQFTSALLSELSKMDYKYLLTEHGRYGLQFLIEEALMDSTILSGISRINTFEYNRLGEYPFPFLTGIEDAEFLSAVLTEKYQIFGIDQEFFYSFPYLFDKLYDKSSKSDTTRERYRAALNFLLAQYEKDAVEKNYPICQNLLESEEIQSFFDLISTDSLKRKIVHDIRRSWVIYKMNRINRQESFSMRGALMRNRFMTFYDSTKINDSINAKYLIRLGALHTMRGTTPLGIKDIGDIVHQTALKNGQKDLNIYFMFRFYLDEEEEFGYFDNAEGNSTWLKERKPLMLQGEPEKWTVVDLNKLKNMVESNKLFVFQPINDIMNRHDYLIIPPASRDVTENRKKE